jgi:F420-dependent oxidoreductase-like protein
VIMNVFTRTPSLTAMTAAGCDSVSGGRFILGLGTSGPQVVEGFHGLPYRHGLARVRDTIEVCRQVWRREPLVYSGRSVEVPLADSAESLRPLKLIDHPVRERIPIWWASMTSAAVAATAELCEGWLPAWFIPEERESVYGNALAAGFQRREPTLPPLEISARTVVAIGEEIEADAVNDLTRPALALYVGGMGSRETNFYNDLAVRYGYEAEAREIQDLYLAGKKAEAAARVPADWIARMNLVGPPAHVAERLAAYREAGVTVVEVEPHGDPLTTIDSLRELIEKG